MSPVRCSVLSHLSFDDPKRIDEAIQALKINGNAVVLMDNDKSYESDELKPNVQKIVDEVKAMDGIAWITAGREIENYIPSNVCLNLFNVSPVPPDKFEMSVSMPIAVRRK